MRMMNRYTGIGLMAVIPAGAWTHVKGSARKSSQDFLNVVTMLTMGPGVGRHRVELRKSGGP